MVEILKAMHTGMNDKEKKATRLKPNSQDAAKLYANSTPIEGLITAKTKKPDIWLNDLFKIE